MWTSELHPHFVVVKTIKINICWHFFHCLIARDVFEKIKLQFLVVGHTHENIDRCFGYLSKKLKKQNNYVLVYLMKAFIISQERPFIPSLIQEILGFKSWVVGCLKDGFETLVGHIDIHLFRFLLIHWASM